MCIYIYMCMYISETAIVPPQREGKLSPAKQ